MQNALDWNFVNSKTHLIVKLKSWNATSHQSIKHGTPLLLTIAAQRICRSNQNSNRRGEPERTTTRPVVRSPLWCSRGESVRNASALMPCNERGQARKHWLRNESDYAVSRRNFKPFRT